MSKLSDQKRQGGLEERRGVWKKGEGSLGCKGFAWWADDRRRWGRGWWRLDFGSMRGDVRFFFKIFFREDKLSSIANKSGHSLVQPPLVVPYMVTMILPVIW